MAAVTVTGSSKIVVLCESSVNSAAVMVLVTVSATITFVAAVDVTGASVIVMVTVPVSFTAGAVSWRQSVFVQPSPRIFSLTVMVVASAVTTTGLAVTVVGLAVIVVVCVAP